MRFCSKCKKIIINEGYVIDGGLEYCCSEECLYKMYSPDEWDKMCKKSDSYWTEWDTVEIDEIEFFIIDVKNALIYLEWGSLEKFISDYTKDDILVLKNIIRKLPSKQCYEWCPYCEEESMISNEFEIQSCEYCGESLMPCSLCHLPDECSPCPF